MAKKRKLESFVKQMKQGATSVVTTIPKSTPVGAKQTTTMDPRLSEWLVQRPQSRQIPHTITAPEPEPGTSSQHQQPVFSLPPPVMVQSVPMPTQQRPDSDSSDSSYENGRIMHSINNSPVKQPSYAWVHPMLMPTAPHISHVPKKIKEKIQAGEYVELYKLYRMDNVNESEPVIVVKGMDLKLSSKPKNNEIFTFSRFFDCFVVFMTIRGQVFPNEYPTMLRHLEIVKMLNGQGCDGILYDKQFRIMKADYPSLVWGYYMAELVVRKQEVSKGFSGANSAGFTGIGNTQQKHPSTCNYFQQGKCTRTACKFKHECSMCHNKSHGRSTCRKIKSNAA